MSLEAKIVVVDDHQMHRSMIGMNLKQAQRKLGGCTFEVVAELENGQELVDQVRQLSPDLITLDIRMPVMDGLTALLHLRKKMRYMGPIIMVSSENQKTMALHHDLRGADAVEGLSSDEKIARMRKLEDRVLTGQVVEGKINSLLDGCEALMLDPRDYALSLGANGFLHKPYKVDQVIEIVPEVLNGKTYQPQ